MSPRVLEHGQNDLGPTEFLTEALQWPFFFKASRFTKRITFTKILRLPV